MSSIALSTVNEALKPEVEVPGRATTLKSASDSLATDGDGQESRLPPPSKMDLLQQTLDRHQGERQLIVTRAPPASCWT